MNLLKAKHQHPPFMKVEKLANHCIKTSGNLFVNISPASLQKHIIHNKEGELTSTGAINVMTGRFTGRSPKDRYIVKDRITNQVVDWGKVNKPVNTSSYASLRSEVMEYLSSKDIYIHDGYACAEPKYKLNIRLYAERAYSALFAYNMFLRHKTAIERPEWNIICAPGYLAEPSLHGISGENFSIINFTKKEILIGGTGYTGEIKKAIFSVLNLTLPLRENVFSMHCSSNIGKLGDTAVFFGLSGTGKTTLSADTSRKLIGDDEHGWGDYGIFNFEGGCYAKCIDLSPEKEPEIYQAIRPGALLENITLELGSNKPDFSDSSITQNTRVSYPIHHISSAKEDSQGGIPSNIFFLVCDAFGVLPPVAKLTREQAMYQFISGYTAKVAGTEDGIHEPVATFSSCFGAPFLPLHPTVYGDMLGEKLAAHHVNVWLINTGWSGGPYGEGKRIQLSHTRTIIRAILNGELEEAAFLSYGAFNLKVPIQVEGIPRSILDPRGTWKDEERYDLTEQKLAKLYRENFTKYSEKVQPEILDVQPQLLTLDNV